MIAPASNDTRNAHRVVLGRIAGVFGTRGWVKVQSYTRPLAGIFGYPIWSIGADDEWREYRVVNRGTAGRAMRARLHGVDDRDAAAKLAGREIAVCRGQLPEPPPGQHYWCDLLGMDVLDQSGRPLGQVTGLRETGAHDVLVVDGPERTLIPFVSGRFIKSVDRERRRISVDWTPGYL